MVWVRLVPLLPGRVFESTFDADGGEATLQLVLEGSWDAAGSVVAPGDGVPEGRGAADAWGVGLTEGVEVVFAGVLSSEVRVAEACGVAVSPRRGVGLRGASSMPGPLEARGASP